MARNKTGSKGRDLEGYFNKSGEYVIYGSASDWRNRQENTQTNWIDESYARAKNGSKALITESKVIAEPTVDVEAERVFTEYIIDFDVQKGPLRTTKPKTYVLQRDGIYAIVSTQFAKFSKLMTSVYLPGQHQGLVEGFILKIPKISYDILNQVVSFFRYFVKPTTDKWGVANSVVEAFVQVYWDSAAKEYFVFVPPQEVSGASVHWNMDTSLDARLGKASTWLVMEIHSHNTMSPHFSSVDDRDEKSPIFFGVIGNINASSFEMTCRYGVDGQFKEVAMDDLFLEVPASVSFPKEWLTRVKKYEYSGSTLVD